MNMKKYVIIIQMSSVKILLAGHLHQSKQRFSTKKKLMFVELSKLESYLSHVKKMSAEIKSLHYSYHLSNHNSCDQTYGKISLEPIKNLIVKLNQILAKDNRIFFNTIKMEQKAKQMLDKQFMRYLRIYQESIAYLNKKIKNLQKSISVYSKCAENDGPWEQFDEQPTSYPFLQHYLKVQQHKQQLFNECVLSALSKRTKKRINSQRTCDSKQKIQDSRSLASNVRPNLSQKILLKEKLVNQRLKHKISVIKKQHEAEKHSIYKFKHAIKHSNHQIAMLHLQAEITNRNNFILEKQQLKASWKNIQKAILSKNCTSFDEIQLKRSKSCTIMQSKIEQDEQSIFMQASVSIQNQCSLLDNLQYFISEEFITDFAGHQLE